MDSDDQVITRKIGHEVMRALEKQNGHSSPKSQMDEAEVEDCFQQGFLQQKAGPFLIFKDTNLLVLKITDPTNYIVQTISSLAWSHTKLDRKDPLHFEFG